jgi:hypothetical protein
MITKEQWLDIVSGGGATLDVVMHNNKIISITNPKYQSGYAVSIKGHELRVQRSISAELLQAYINLKSDVIQENENARVGLWENKGYWYLDISFIYSNIYNAGDAARINKQKAIYSFKQQASIDVNSLEVIK